MVGSRTARPTEQVDDGSKTGAMLRAKPMLWWRARLRVRVQVRVVNGDLDGYTGIRVYGRGGQ